MLTQSPLRRRSIPTDVKQQSPVIQLTALYEDLEAGLRAKSLLEGVKSRVMSELPVHFRLELWRFDWLGESSLSRMALGSARGSSLVVVCATSDNSPPAELDRWLQAWAQVQDKQTCALVLFANPEICREQHPLHDCLQRAARRKGVEFLCEDFADEPEDRALVTSYLRNREEKSSGQPVRRCGFTAGSLSFG